ncbi:(2Fe-2S)-binding protein [Sphaerotilus microaerophilus]|jgi:bacterioferritin-associated ferredoxin|uniref:Bacterioferritin-associated ferredoxin n=1 Tax=Sphaerotilus microaerophilus TaxID=2914710 RepID=A0ABM7YR23_9BURK|nr:(2Fe-2S)-binding protein [Sphaerotilus sp. FB-5]BDI07004.1 bacterioferritin-associated ferredoxin [Sphaerotilus sp. FB-5]
MIVCVCHRVSDRDIAREVRSGCDSFEDLQRVLHVGTRCGQCLSHARAAFETAAGACGGTCPCDGAARPASALLMACVA